MFASFSFFIAILKWNLFFRYVITFLKKFGIVEVEVLPIPICPLSLDSEHEAIIVQIGYSALDSEHEAITVQIDFSATFDRVNFSKPSRNKLSTVIISVSVLSIQ